MNPIRWGIGSADRAKLAVTGQPGRWRLAGLLLIGAISLFLTYAWNNPDTSAEIAGAAAERENSVALSIEKSRSTTQVRQADEDASLDRMFTFDFDNGLRQQILTVNGCDAVLAVDIYNAISGDRVKQELSRFDLRRFHLVDSDVADRLTLVADAEADDDLLLWYDALAGEAVGDDADWAQTLLLRADAGEFGSFVARNRQETRIFSGDTISAPIPRPLLEVSIRLPQEAVPAMEAWRSHVRDHCHAG